jgi:hypothetical protein
LVSDEQMQSLSAKVLAGKQIAPETNGHFFALSPFKFSASVCHGWPDVFEKENIFVQTDIAVASAPRFVAKLFLSFYGN